MSRVRSDSVGTIMRRVAQLRADGYDEAFLKPLARGAEDLEIHQRYPVEGEQLIVQLIATQRRLRSALVNLFHLVQSHIPAGLIGLPAVQKALEECKPIGDGRHILNLEITTQKSRRVIEAELSVLLDEYFKPGRMDGIKEITTTEGAAGQDAGDAGGSSRARDASQPAARRVP